MRKFARGVPLRTVIDEKGNRKNDINPGLSRNLGQKPAKDKYKTIKT